ncbi:MAG: caspase family protein [Bacteroidota bacterium]
MCVTFGHSQTATTATSKNKQQLELKFDSFTNVYDALDRKGNIYINRKENRLVISERNGMSFYSIVPFRKMNYVADSVTDSIADALEELEGTKCVYFSEYSINFGQNCDDDAFADDFMFSDTKKKKIHSRKLDKEEAVTLLDTLKIDYKPLKLISALIILDIDLKVHSTIESEERLYIEDGELIFPEGFDVLKYIKYVIVNYDDKCIAYTNKRKKVFEENMAAINFYNNGAFLLTSYEMISPLAKFYTGKSFAGFEIAKKHIYLLDLDFSNKQFVASIKNQERDEDKTRQLALEFKKDILSAGFDNKIYMPKNYTVATYINDQKTICNVKDIKDKKSYDNIIISTATEQLDLIALTDSNKNFKYEILGSNNEILIVIQKEILGDSKISKNELLFIGLANKQIKCESLLSFFSYLKIEDILFEFGEDNYVELIIFFFDTSTNTRILENLSLDFFGESEAFHVYDILKIYFEGARIHMNNEDEEDLFFIINNDFGYTKNVYESYINIHYHLIDMKNGSYYQYYNHEYPKNTFFINNMTSHDALSDSSLEAYTNEEVDAANLEETPVYYKNLVVKENLQVTYDYVKISQRDHLYVQKDIYQIKVADKQQTVNLKTYSRKFGLEYAITPSVLLGFSNDMKYFLFYSNDNTIDGSLKVYDFEKGKFIFTKYIGSHRSSMNIDYFQGMSFAIFNDRLIIRYNNVSSEIYDIKTSEKLADYYYYSDEEWYVVTPNGLYDKASKKTDKLYYVYDKKELFDLDQFKKEYQYSDLLSLVLGTSNREYPKQINLQKEIKNLPPKISYELIDNTTLKGTIQKREGDASDIFFCIAGIEKQELRPRFDKGIATFEIDLSKLKDDFVEGDNAIYVKAANTFTTITSKGPILNYVYEKTRSSSDDIKSTNDSNDTPISTAKLYALFVGIEDYYKNGLEYAEDDANEMKKYVELINKNLYTTEPEITYLPSAKATKKNIITALKDIQDKSDAEDVVLLYFSGHGITGEALEYNPKDTINRNFYFITVDFNDATRKSFSEISVDKRLQSEQALSSTELNYYLSGREMNPQKKILIMDACYSGRILESDPEPIAEIEKSDKNNRTRAQEKALQELNDKTGTIILTASRSNNKAYETNHLQHSFLAWGLLKALKDKDYGEFGNNVQVDAWLKYAKYIVENEIRDVNIQKPVINTNEDVDFAIGSVKDDVLKDFTLKGTLPIMYDAEIGSALSLRSKAKEIQLNINNALAEYSKDKEIDDKKFTYLKSEFGTTGYRIVGRISNENDQIKLAFYLSKNEKTIELSLTPSSNPDYQYEVILDNENLEKNIDIFVKKIINQL